MNHTEIMLKNLNAGELQNLACDLLPRLYQDWGGLNKSGGVEGTYKTRKGTPDAWCERDDNTLVYIQATGDCAKGKIFEDLEKSVTKLNNLGKNKDALCISFLNFDPQSDEIEKCRVYTEANKCQFKYYSNSEIAKVLDQKYPRLKEKYLKLYPLYKAKNIPSLLLRKEAGIPPRTAKKINAQLWKLPDEDLEVTRESIIGFFNILCKLSKPSREFFTTIVTLGELARTSFVISDTLTVPAQEIENALGLNPSSISKQMEIIEKYKLGHIAEYEDSVHIRVSATDWRLLPDLKLFAASNGIDLKEILVDLNFSLLD